MKDCAPIFVFVMGAACGAAVHRQWGMPVVHRRTQVQFGSGAGVYQGLALSPDQRREIDGILRRLQPRSDSLLSDVLPALRVVADSVDAEVLHVLTADQRVKLDSLRGQGKTNPFADVTPKSVALQTAAVEVPLLLLGRAPGVLPVVEIMINGNGPFRFGIETGAQFIGMRPGLADSLGLSPAPKVQEQLPAYHADSLTIGAATFRDLPLAVIQTAARDIDGFLGLPTFHDLLLTIDYPKHVVRFERGELPVPNGRDVLPLLPINDGFFWGVPAAIEGKPYTAVIDTRWTGSFQITPETASQLTFDGELQVVGTARGAAIATTEVKAGVLAGAVTLGRYTFPKPEAAVRALPPGFPTVPLLGTIVLQQFRVTIDQLNGRIRLTREGDPTIELPRRLPPKGP